MPSLLYKELKKTNPAISVIKCYAHCVYMSVYTHNLKYEWCSCEKAIGYKAVLLCCHF